MRVSTAVMSLQDTTDAFPKDNRYVYGPKIELYYSWRAEYDSNVHRTDLESRCFAIKLSTLLEASVGFEPMTFWL